MKTKLKDQFQQDVQMSSKQDSSSKKIQSQHGRGWEMSAEDALRVDYVHRSRFFISQ